MEKGWLRHFENEVLLRHQKQKPITYPLRPSRLQRKNPTIPKPGKSIDLQSSKTRFGMTYDDACRRSQANDKAFAEWRRRKAQQQREKAAMVSNAPSASGASSKSGGRPARANPAMQHDSSAFDIWQTRKKAEARQRKNAERKAMERRIHEQKVASIERSRRLALRKRPVLRRPRSAIGTRERLRVLQDSPLQKPLNRSFGVLKSVEMRRERERLAQRKKHRCRKEEDATESRVLAAVMAQAAPDDFDLSSNALRTSLSPVASRPPEPSSTQWTVVSPLIAFDEGESFFSVSDEDGDGSIHNCVRLSTKRRRTRRRRRGKRPAEASSRPDLPQRPATASATYPGSARRSGGRRLDFRAKPTMVYGSLKPRNRSKKLNSGIVCRKKPNAKILQNQLVSSGSVPSSVELAKAPPLPGQVGWSRRRVAITHAAKAYVTGMVAEGVKRYMWSWKLDRAMEMEVEVKATEEAVLLEKELPSHIKVRRVLAEIAAARICAEALRWGVARRERPFRIKLRRVLAEAAAARVCTEALQRVVARQVLLLTESLSTKVTAVAKFIDEPPTSSDRGVATMVEAHVSLSAGNSAISSEHAAIARPSREQIDARQSAIQDLDQQKAVLVAERESLRVELNQAKMHRVLA